MHFRTTTVTQVDTERADQAPVVAVQVVAGAAVIDRTRGQDEVDRAPLLPHPLLPPQLPHLRGTKLPRLRITAETNVSLLPKVVSFCLCVFYAYCCTP